MRRLNGFLPSGFMSRMPFRNMENFPKYSRTIEGWKVQVVPTHSGLFSRFFFFFKGLFINSYLVLRLFFSGINILKSFVTICWFSSSFYVFCCFYLVPRVEQVGLFPLIIFACCAEILEPQTPAATWFRSPSLRTYQIRNPTTLSLVPEAAVTESVELESGSPNQWKNRRIT